PAALDQLAPGARRLAGPDGEQGDPPGFAPKQRIAVDPEALDDHPVVAADGLPERRPVIWQVPLEPRAQAAPAAHQACLRAGFERVIKAWRSSTSTRSRRRSAGPSPGRRTAGRTPLASH